MITRVFAKIAALLLALLARIPLPVWIAAPFVATAAASGVLGKWVPEALAAFIADNPESKPVLAAEGFIEFAGPVRLGLFGLAGMMILLALCTLVKKPFILKAIRESYIFIYALILLYAYAVIDVSGLFIAKKIAVVGDVPTGDTVLFWRMGYLLPVPFLGALTLVAHVIAYQSAIIERYSGRADKLAPGDLIANEIRRKIASSPFVSTGISIFAHVFIFLILPLLLQLFGPSVEPYGVPFGRGTPDAGGGATKAAPEKAELKKKAAAVKPPTKAEKKSYKGKIVFLFTSTGPTLGDSSAIQELDKLTQDTYKADTNVVAGGQGSGTGGGKGPGNKAGGIGKGGTGPGGWPDGMKDSVVRFIRLEYASDPKWNDGMDDINRVDLNFLDEFNRETGFRVSDHTESIKIKTLLAFPKGKAPPFVYVTGIDRIQLTPGEITVLRDYLLDGGMLFADCGGPGWDQSFRQLIPQIFPDKSLVTLSDGDTVFQAPYNFPNGAPPLWHHGGFRSLGVKHDGRWVVFYHPGDLKDAWKTGHSGIDPKLARDTMHLGINVVYYAFTNYLERTMKYRK